ncbi:hypothetical protein LIA77_01681 [Sarocladium implicatum]|nr:hypothetical protein LIA77_01681 [Sarocladium implicatum]
MCFIKTYRFMCEKCTDETEEPQVVNSLCQMAIDTDPAQELEKLYGKCGTITYPQVYTQRKGKAMDTDPLKCLEVLFRKCGSIGIPQVFTEREGICDGCIAMEKALKEKQEKA